MHGPFQSHVKRSSAAAGYSGALITELKESEEIADSFSARLPLHLQEYVDTTRALKQRVVAEAAGELPLECLQSAQNLQLLLTLPSLLEVSDLRLGLTGQRLTLSLCTRGIFRTGEGAGEGDDAAPPWKRHVIRRTLCGLVDIRQWHCELIQAQAGEEATSASGAVCQVLLVLRKADGSREFWPEVLNVNANDCVDDSDLAAETADAAWAEEDSIAIVNGTASPSSSSRVHRGDAESAEPDTQDSTELDAAAPVNEVARRCVDAKKEEGLSGADRGTTVTAADARVQSAMVMGQSVLLRTRLMYQLL